MTNVKILNNCKNSGLHQRIKLSFINICCLLKLRIFDTITKLAGRASNLQKSAKQLQDLQLQDGRVIQNFIFI